MEKLKTCPFCGAEAEIDSDPRFGGAYIICSGCEVRTLVYKTVKKAAAIWNRRVADAEQDN